VLALFDDLKAYDPCPHKSSVFMVEGEHLQTTHADGESGEDIPLSIVT
jgi:hypothetical protein